MDYYGQYRAKLRTADEAVRQVKSGDWVDYSSNNGFPESLDAALARRRDELWKVKVRGNFIRGPVQVAECDDSMEHFVYNTWHCSGYERKLCDRGRAFFSPMTFRNLEWYYRSFLTVNVAMVSAAPMDRHGYFNLGCAVGISKAIIDCAQYVIIEVNEAMPRIRGGEGESVHISQVDCVVEAGNRPLWEMTQPEPGETDTLIARHILPHITDGATVQLGVGGMPNALGELIARSELRDLGMHTELCSDAYLSMFEAGKLTNRKKTLHREKGVVGLLIGSRALYDWADDDPGLAGYPLSYVNDPAVIALNENMISINGCLGVDIYGQTASESVGLRQISGSGGQMDFVEGAIRSKGGKSFLCMSSTYTDKDGLSRSRIRPRFEGDIVTTPRSLSCYIATEHGAVDLAGLSTWERAERLISIAHPDHREALIKDAERQKIWLPSNKR